MKIKIKLKKVYIFGESHFHFDEVQRIRNEILKIKPDLVLHELYEDDKSFYEENNIKIERLEKEIPTQKDIKTSFKIRENNILNKIIDSIQKYNKICIVIGDTHLRTISTKELGPTSPIHIWASKKGCVEIIRSKYGEIE